ncbi:PREDICTED: sorting nexin-25 isoform X1 [Papilio xuthus]|uniref:Sorting nexin-25 isoform X1 n=1 Tax=Papilio xuthus TaxID=66420 RepID=A0AAJ7EFH6_PAPXU|nr:PREDICTED: sorting nexin-25 isoform X1 [Papilio xuthus]
MLKWILFSTVPISISIFWYFPLLWSITYLMLLSAFIGIGIFMLTFWGHIALSSPHQASLFLLDKAEKESRFLEETIREDQNSWVYVRRKSHLAVIFGRTVDSQLQLLIDYLIRDFVARWLKELSHKPEPVIDKFKEHMWGAVQTLYERLLRIDAEKLLANDMVTKITQHFERIRIARSCALELNQPPVFALAPHLTSCETELHYLRQISELLIMFLMPRCYSLTPVSHLLREILACKILQPAINLVTEPDYINQKIIQYLEAQKEVDAMHVRTHEYAKTFEDYIRLINSCNNVDTLKRLRYDIVTQIMQATTLQNMKRAKGIDVDIIEKSSAQHNISRQQLADAKKLKRYINQLTIAKVECEKALKKLGWDGAFPAVESDSKTLPLHKVMESVTGRRYLSMFLETMCSQGLVGFWTAVEELRHSPRSSWHQLGAEIFYTYIRSPSAEIKVDKETRKRMEAFLLGDKGPEVFYEVQETVVDTIQEKYYSSFLLSDQYKALVVELAKEEANKDLSSDRSPVEDRQMSAESASSAESAGGTVHLAEHSTYARRKLDQLQERHNNKTQALAALRASLKPESPALAMLANEVERLAGEQMRLEAHLARTDTWAEHLGRWRASVHSAEVIDESKPPQFVIVVHMAEQEPTADDERPEQISTGWVLLRTLNEFQELHRKLRPMCSELKNLELPSNSFKFLFGKNDRQSLEKAKTLIQKYLEFVLEDDRLNQSEALYTFLNPSSEYLKQGDLPKKNKFSFSTFFKSTSSEAGGVGGAARWSGERGGEGCGLAADDEEMSLYLDGNGSDTPRHLNNSIRGAVGMAEERDSIAEPLYALLSEVFDMRGVFRWLRKTLVTFVQITYGRTINRQIKETISWLFCEHMLHYYTGVVLKSWWPGGVLSETTNNRNLRDKEHTRTLALQQLSESVAGALGSLLGAHTAARGAHKLFHTLQNTTHNKQLFYELFEVVLLEVFPELKRYQ